MCAYQTGRCPVTSSKGNKHLLIAYDWDSNAILAHPLKSKSAVEHLQTIKTLHQFLNKKGVHPKLHIMDNECSQLVKDYIKDEQGIDLLLVPPFLRRVNAAEKAIDICKTHFITGLATVHPSFPMHLWCRLVHLATSTLNLLRPSRINPKLSAYEVLHGTFDHGKTPLAPPGCKVLVHENTHQRGSWNLHEKRDGTSAWPQIIIGAIKCMCHKLNPKELPNLFVSSRTKCPCLSLTKRTLCTPLLYSSLPR